jgi:hypothetical protein
MASKRIERQIDEALLMASLGTGFVYVRRRVRRVRRKLAIGGAILAGTGAAVATAGAAGVVGGVVARYRGRAKKPGSV